MAMSAFQLQIGTYFILFNPVLLPLVQMDLAAFNIFFIGSEVQRSVQYFCPGSLMGNFQGSVDKFDDRGVNKSPREFSWFKESV